MTLFILTETAAGYGLFKATDKKLLKREGLAEKVEDPTFSIKDELTLRKFQRFDSAATALEEMSNLVEGKVTPLLTSLLDELKDEKKVSLAVADQKLGKAINQLPQFSITPISDASSTGDIYRAIRGNITDLIPGLLPENMKTMSLGLSHSLSRHKVKFSPEKVDVMIIQAINLLDDLDKELNGYAMRVKEWYGWHFPELGKILNDNIAYARIIVSVGNRDNFATKDLSDILPEEIEAAVKSAAEVSMGTEMLDEDLENIVELAEQVISYSEYRSQLSNYLEGRMKALSPNLTELLGYLVGARMIAHTGSLMDLAKKPGSTIQVVGAEKALFRALKTKHSTPKYGLIYHASLVGQATGRNKGKIARMLAAKAAIGVRTDALSDWTQANGEEADDDTKVMLGVASRSKIERALRTLENKPLLGKGVAIKANGDAAAPGKWNIKEARKYNKDADGLAGDEPAAKAASDDVAVSTKPAKSSKKSLPAAKNEDEDEDMADGDDDEDEDANMADAAGTNGAAARSPTLSSVSDDSEDISDAHQELWQSSIEGATREAKKLRKKERHQRDVDLAPERSAKRAAKKAQKARREEREERRWQKQEQLKRREARAEGQSAPATTTTGTVKSSTPKAVVSVTTKTTTPAKFSDADYERFAAAAGISVSKFKRKFERGDVELTEDGTPRVFSKKELKKLKKATEEAESGSKRKRDDEEEKPKKKKKKSIGAEA